MNYLPTHSSTENGIYLVREEWSERPFDAATYFDYVFVPPLKIFKKKKKNEW